MSQRALAAGAIRAAAALRAHLGHGPGDAVCPFDIAERVGVETHLMSAPSLEGMYAEHRQAIVINCLRPAGRRRYTCAHELGHQVNGHGTSFDAEGELIEDRADEFVANQFARALLMPKLVVASAFARRGWSPRDASPEMAFVVAQDVGVGFTTLLDHMSLSLNLIARTSAERLSKTRLPALRERLVGREVEHDLFVVDGHWGARPLDLEVGDLVQLAAGAEFDGACARGDGGVVHATASGVGELRIVGRATPITVRVSRRDYAGRSVFRHLEEVPDE